MVLNTIEKLPAASLDAAGPVSAGLVALSPGIVMLGFAGPLAGLDIAGIRLGAPEGGPPVAPPFSWHRLPGRHGGTGRLLLLARSQPALAPGAILHLSDGSGDTEPTIGIVDLPDIPDLIGRTDAATTLAVLRFVAAKATGILRRGDDAALAETCHRLAESVLSPERTALPVARCGHDLAMWSLPGPAQAPDGAQYALGRRCLRRVPVHGATTVLPDRQFEDGYLLPAEGEGPIHLAPTHGRPPPTLAELGKRKDAASLALHRAGLAELARRAAADADSRRLLRDLQLLAPTGRPHHYAAPQRPFGAALEMALCDHAGGVFLRGWLRDPMGLVAGLALRGPYGEQALDPAALLRFPRPDLGKTYADSPHGGAGPRPGFALHLPSAAAGRPVAQWSLRVALTTGDRITLTAPPAITHPRAARDAVLGAIAPQHATPALMRGCISPAVERLHRAAMAGHGAPEVLRLGPRAAEPVASLVVPLYRNLRFLRHQLAAIARDPALRDAAELVYVLDSPEQRDQVEHLLRGLNGLYCLPLTLVVQADNHGYAAACNAGAAVARAPVLLMLNSDVVPADRGWLQPLLRALGGRRPSRRSPVAAGPKLLFEDGSLQHAGLFFEPGPWDEWFNNHYHKGYPRHFPAAQEFRTVPGITGAAFCVRRDAFEAVGGFCTDYVIGDYEDSDLCLKLRAAGGEIAYVPDSELYHFERQSIRDHGGYARSLAAHHNRGLHHRRWAADIERLMARFGQRPAARAGEAG